MLLLEGMNSRVNEIVDHIAPRACRAPRRFGILDKVLGWTASKRTPTLPDVPTMAEAGYAGVELEIWQGIVAPAGTPPAIVRKLNTELIRAAQSPDVVEKVAAQAVEMTTITPEDFAKLLASDIERLGKLIRDAGIKAQ